MVLWMGVWAAIAGCGDAEKGGDRGGVQDDGPRDAGTDAGPDAEMPDAEVPLACDDLECHPLALCDDRDGTAECACNEGLSGDGIECDDLDECDDGSANCDANATCLNRYRSHVCRCDDGYAGDGTSCSDVNECIGETNVCNTDAACDNVPGGLECACKMGFSGDGRACADVDECAADEDDCAVGEVCRNRRPHFVCECPAGQARNPLDGSCTDPCTAAGCGSDRCSLDGDGASCTCVDGFADDGNDTCVQDADCSGCGANTVCDGNVNGCACAPGYEGDPMAGCTESACDGSRCSPNGQCSDTGDGFLCLCDDGYVASGGECEDRDECADGSDLCDDNATCTNTVAAYTCACNAGFTGDGLSCADVDECAGDADDCADDGSAVCTNTFGSFLCACAPGSEGDPRAGCTDIDECAAGVDLCDDDATCDNASVQDDPLGYGCTCNDGFIGTGLSCQRLDPCVDSRLNDCDPNALCTSDGDSFECSCEAPFEGDGKACTCALSGYWAMRQDVMIRWPEQAAGGLVLIDEGSQVATIWELHRYEYDGTEINVTKKGCGADRSPNIYSPLYEEVYGTHIPDEVFDDLDLAQGKAIPLAREDAVPGHAYQTPQEAAVVGMVLDDPENDPWPESRTDVADDTWSDVEDDGVPGITAWPRSALLQTPCGTPEQPCNYSYPAAGFEPGTTRIVERVACVSLASRVITHTNAELRRCDLITGNVVNEQTDVRVHSCTLVGPAVTPETGWTEEVGCTRQHMAQQRKCTDAHADFLDDQSQDQMTTATFELLHIGSLDDDINCPDVREALPALPRQ